MKKAIPIFLLLLTFSPVSSAQYRGAFGSSWNNPVSALSNVQMWNNINGATSRRLMLKSSLRKYGCTDSQMNAMATEAELMQALSRKSCGASGTAGGSPRGSAGGPRSASVAAMRQVPAPIAFRPSGTRTMLPQIVAGISQDPSEQAALAKVIGGAMEAFESAQRARGSQYDLAAAMSFFASIAIQLQHPETEINSAGGDALTYALRESLGSKLSAVGDSDKQQLYEALLSLGMLFALSSRNADANTMAQLKQASAEASRKLLNLDVGKYRFTSDGLASVK